VEKTEKILVAFEEHNGSTGAQSEWRFAPPPLEQPVFVGGGTHRKYITVVELGTKAILRRVSNRGNIRYTTVEIKEPAFLDFLGSVYPLPKNYEREARRLGWL